MWRERQRNSDRRQIRQAARSAIRVLDKRRDKPRQGQEHGALNSEKGFVDIDEGERTGEDKVSASSDEDGLSSWSEDDQPTCLFSI